MKAILLTALLACLPQGDPIGDLQHINPEVRKHACALLAQKGVKAAVPYLIELLQTETEEPVRREALAALEHLTELKEKFGPDAKRWKQWWDEEGRKTFPTTTLSPDEIQRIVRPSIDDVYARTKEAKSEIRVLAITVAGVVLVFILVMIYFVGHVSSKLKEWKDLVSQAQVYIEESRQITQRTDKVLEELDAKKEDIVEFVKTLKDEKESEIERYADLLQQNTGHHVREDVMALRQKAEKELEETLAQLRQQVELEVRRLGTDQKEKIERDFRTHHDQFIKEVEAHTLFLQAGFAHNCGKLEEALGLYKKFLALKADHPVAWERLGLVYRDLRRWEETIEALQKSVTLDPNGFSAHYHMAAAFARLRRRDKMLAALASAVKGNAEFKDEALNDPAFREFWNDTAFKDLTEV